MSDPPKIIAFKPTLEQKRANLVNETTLAFSLRDVCTEQVNEITRNELAFKMKKKDVEKK